MTFIIWYLMDGDIQYLEPVPYCALILKVEIWPVLDELSKSLRVARKYICSIAWEGFPLLLKL